MGVKNWGDIIPWRWESSSEIAPGTIAIDVPNYLSRRISVIRQNPEQEGRLPLTHVGLFVSLVKVTLSNHVLPVFVFDGPPETRKRQPNPGLVQRASEMYKKFQRDGDPYDEDIATELWKSPALRMYFAADHIRDLARVVGVPVITAPSEAEMFAAVLCRDGAVNTVVSNDADALLFGSPHVTKQLQLSTGKILRTTLSEFKEEIQLDLEHLRDLAIVCGCDFHEAGVKGIGPRRGAVLLQKHGDLEGLLRARGFVASERVDFIEAREVFNEASYLSAEKMNFKLNPPLVPKVLRTLETVMPSERAEITTQKITNLWRSFGNRQSTLEQWL
ncbi:MAG: hypothetical protein ACFFEV_07745 [Candidatus Thorarchaeota archaeon]